MEEMFFSLTAHETVFLIIIFILLILLLIYYISILLPAPVRKESGYFFS